MTMIGDRMQKVLGVFRDDQEVLKKSQIYELGAPWGYYYKGYKHLGDVLTRMVRNGLLMRPKPGYYKRTGRVNPIEKLYQQDPNQKQLEL